ncbi:hypothetical protein QN277_026092 [Acacia crassicarpa]|uniref:Uncharacterized protein n=1 Tax=Acacia crassicarpa TaxID=499986 RepID=A0AAE1J731_9FABA|nr:hypothetical protein QN277_026092 [Acacia crassicarpa]
MSKRMICLHLHQQRRPEPRRMLSFDQRFNLRTLSLKPKGSLSKNHPSPRFVQLLLYQFGKAKAKRLRQIFELDERKPEQKMLFKDSKVNSDWAHLLSTLVARRPLPPLVLQVVIRLDHSKSFNLLFLLWVLSLHLSLFLIRILSIFIMVNDYILIWTN